MNQSRIGETKEGAKDRPVALLLRASEVAGMLNISERTLWRMRSARQVPQPIRVGGTVRWQRLEIESWIADGCPKQDGDSR